VVSEPDLGPGQQKHPEWLSYGFAHRFSPAHAQGDGRVLLLLHGTGGNEDDLLPLAQQLDPQAALLSPRGKVLESGMPRFFRRFPTGGFDVEDLKYRTEELADFVQAASDHYSFDRRKIVAVGYSNGANIAASLLLLRPETLAAAVLLHAMVPLAPDAMPDLRAKPVFLTGGQTDVLIPAQETARLADLLREAGADVRLQWQPGGHALSPSEIQAAQNWLTSLDLPVRVVRERPSAQSSAGERPE
jgi:predicted esterase